jgi:hypothetical protein
MHSDCIPGALLVAGSGSVFCLQQIPVRFRDNLRFPFFLPTHCYSGAERKQLPTSAEVREVAFRHGRIQKRLNAITALLSAALPAAILACYFHPGWAISLLGLMIGLVWGNAFEYAYHRWLLHRPGCTFAKGHLAHHAHVGTSEDAEHVSLGKSPWHIAILFAGNEVVVISLDLLLNLSVSPGIFMGWAIYLIVAEEIHWRIHMDGWLPVGLRFARAYHLAHHDIPNSRYNVFLPMFDCLLGTGKNSTRPLTEDRSSRTTQVDNYCNSVTMALQIREKH